MKELYVKDRETGEAAVRAIADVLAEGKPFRIQIVPADYKPYTTKQLRKAHAIFGDIAKGTAHTVDEVKVAMMDKFFPATYFDFMGQRCVYRKSFSDLNRDEASHLIDMMEAWAAEQGIYVK